ncbi:MULTISPECIES: thiamine-phosphate kinase [unclassified Janibacter]|uniref:thiamine-phosphate kinase n=1 Tax=unclassified Janibacter TaxID=2649294 RepID=UPI003D04FE81
MTEGAPEPGVLADLDEEGLLRRILPLFASAGDATRVTVGPGDDAAVLAVPTGAVVATTDTMVRGRDWLDEWSTGREVGAKVVAQNVADVAAMGGVATGLLLTLTADPQTRIDWVLELSAGIAHAAADAGVAVLGGDLSSAPAGVVMVSITALGEIPGRTVLRSGAKVGHVVAVCGSLGWSGAGWWLHEQGHSPTITAPDDDGQRLRAPLMGEHRQPRPPYESGPIAAAAGASAMLDISDGLVRDAGRIAAASGVAIDLEGAALERDFLPPLAAVMPADVAWRQLLTGGEEHSLLATFPSVEQVPVDREAPWWVIGRVVPAGDEPGRVTVDGVVPQGRGWDHFAG